MAASGAFCHWPIVSGRVAMALGAGAPVRVPRTARELAGTGNGKTGCFTDRLGLAVGLAASFATAPRKR